jgi:hypothetical protein
VCFVDNFGELLTFINWNTVLIKCYHLIRALSSCRYVKVKRTRYSRCEVYGFMVTVMNSFTHGVFKFTE